jgi:hypothetical protein
VGGSLREDLASALVIDALRMAWSGRSPGPKAGLIFPSDRGSQYASYEFHKVLEECGIRPARSRPGNCWDNAGRETRFGSRKGEGLPGEHCATLRQAKEEALDWLFWYHPTGMHSTLDSVRPMQFEPNAAFHPEALASGAPRPPKQALEKWTAKSRCPLSHSHDHDHEICPVMGFGFWGQGQRRNLPVPIKPPTVHIVLCTIGNFW